MRTTNEEDIDQLALAWELPQTNNDLWPTLCARLEAEQPSDPMLLLLQEIRAELAHLREDNQTLRREVLALREEVQRQNRRPGEGVQLLPYAPKSDFPFPFS